MKKFFENWRKHLENQDLIEMQTQALNELSEHDYEMIKNWMRDAPEEAYSFGNIFGNKKRIAIPVETGAAKGPIGKIVRFFQDNGWKIDFSNSTASKEIEAVIPKGPKAGEKIKQVRKMRIGKALSYAKDLFVKYDKFQSMESTRENQKKAKEITTKLKQGFPSTFGYGSVIKNINTLDDLIKFWNEKSEFYRQNPDAAFEKESPYVTILSRHPVDVVRMSDMNDIKSCHSRGGGYFQCAVAESRGHGPIAYLVPRKQFEQYFDVDLSETNPEDVDLDAGAEEIFADRERGIPGLRPEGRVRLRKFVSNEDGRMITAPERRTYAPGGARTPPNFLKGVTKWALESQKDVIGDPKKLAQEFYDEDWVRYGGSYEDTDDGEVMARMLEPVLDDKELLRDLEQAGKMPQELEDEDEIEQDLEGGSVEEQSEEIQDRADRELKHLHIYHEIGGGGWDDEEAIYFNAGLTIELDDEFGEALDENGEETSWNDREEEVNEIIESAMDSNDIYPEMGNVEIYDDQWRTDWATYDLTPDIHGFDRFVDEVIRGDQNWEEMIEDVRQALSDEGIIERLPTEYEKALEQFKRYKNIAVQFDADDKRVVASPRNPIILDKNYRNFKEFDANAQETIKYKFRDLFTSAIYHLVLLPNAKGTIGSLKKVFDPIKQGLLVDLDGVKVKFILDFQDVLESDRKHLRTEGVLTIDEVKRFLNLLNAPIHYNKIIKEAQDSYKKAIEVVHQNPIVPREDPKETEQETLSESKNVKVSDKMLFESWRRYLGK